MRILPGPVIILISLWSFYELFKNIEQKRNLLILIMLIVVLSWIIEYIGISYGFPFGDYNYSDMLQPSVAGVPLAIAFAWPCAVITSIAFMEEAFGMKVKSFFSRTFIASTFILVFDIFLEQAAISENYWQWAKGMVPLTNYISWFSIGFIFTFVILKARECAYPKILVHIYISQILFFMLSSL